jgi:hypothetical protein
MRGMKHIRSAVAHAAPQHLEGTITPPQTRQRQLRRVELPIAPLHVVSACANTGHPIPLARMSGFRPGGGQGGIGAHIGYSPYCVPRIIEGVKCVIVNEALRDIELMAWDFVMNFARDNELQVVEACLLPEAPKTE